MKRATGLRVQSYVGLILSILFPPEAFTNSLLMNKPVGSVNFFPLGAVKSTESPDILKVDE